MFIPVNIIDGLGFELLLLVVLFGLAAYRLSRLVIQDEITRPTRELIWSKFPPTTQIGYFFTCYSCVGFWSALVLLATFLLWPLVVLVIVVLLAISAIVVIIDDLLNR